MRLLTIRISPGTIAVVERDGGRFVVRDDAGRAYRDVGDLLRSGPDWRARAERATERAAADASIARPILDPGAVVCVGLNFRKHVLEMGRELPTAPTLFSKLARALTDPGTDIALPAASQKVDYEGEVGVVIGRGGRDIAAADAWDAVAGLTLVNDVSMRDFQKRSLQFFAGKTWQRSTPVGPAVVTLDEWGGPEGFARREIVTRVNGEERQRGPLSDLIFDVPTLVADLSRIVALEPGDLIATGTPGGVGDAMKPPRYLQHGDVVEIEFERIGVLRNRFLRGA